MTLVIQEEAVGFAERRVPVIVLAGEFGAHNWKEFTEVRRRHTEGGDYWLIIDMAEVGTIDTAALGSLVTCHKRCREGGGRMALVIRGAGAVFRALTVTGFIKVLSVHYDRKAAVEAVME